MSNWLPSLNALRAFESVSRHLNYKLAAEELSVTPAAVKQLVSKLEDSVGVQLLERQGRGLALTHAGNTGSEDLTEAFRKIAITVDKMRIHDHDSQLVISVDPSFAASWLIPRLESFKKDNPSIVLLIDSSIKLADLYNGHTDIGIRFGVENHGDLIPHRLFDEELCAFCSPILYRGINETNGLADLKNQNLLGWDLSEFKWANNTVKWNEWQHWISQAKGNRIKINTSQQTRFNDYNLTIQAAIAGQGFILGSKPILQNLIDANLLICPFEESVIPGIGYDLVTSENTLSRPSVKRFIEWIKAETL
jgi:LysR family glycine cleavage system transcriptional activator